MRFKNFLKILGYILLVLIILTLIIYFWNLFGTFFSDIVKVRDFILGFGILAPFIFIALVILQVLFAPIPGQFIGFVGGFLFGIYLGVIYSMIGLILGSWIVFIIARKLGRPFVERIINKTSLKKFDKLMDKKGKMTLFLIYLLPAFPDDLISYLAGLTKIRIGTLILISTIGRLPGFVVLNLVGAGIASQNSTPSIIVFVVVMILSFFIYFYQESLEKLMTNVVKKIR